MRWPTAQPCISSSERVFRMSRSRVPCTRSVGRATGGFLLDYLQEDLEEVYRLSCRSSRGQSAGTSLLMSVFNPQGWDLAGVRFLFICCSMAAMGVVMVFERDALFPDKLDYQVRRDSAVGLLPHQLDDASRSSSERLV